jgi:hypothetical protein
MKRRARRVTIAVAVLGAAVVGVFVVLQFRLHLQAWNFQRTRKTVKIEPDPGLRTLLAGITGAMEMDVKTCLRVLSAYSRSSVIAEQEETARARVLRSKNPEDREPLVLTALTAAAACDALEARGWRIIKQRLPREAYVVFREERIQALDGAPWPWDSSGSRSSSGGTP